MNGEALTREQVEECIALTVGPQCDDSEAACARLLAHDQAQRDTIDELRYRLQTWNDAHADRPVVEKQPMNAVKRYVPLTNGTAFIGMGCNDGLNEGREYPYVLYDDYAALQAKLAGVEKERDEQKTAIVAGIRHRQQYVETIESLKAQLAASEQRVKAFEIHLDKYASPGWWHPGEGVSGTKEPVLGFVTTPEQVAAIRALAREQAGLREALEDCLEALIISHPDRTEFRRQLESGELHRRLLAIGPSFDPNGRVHAALKARQALAPEPPRGTQEGT